MFNKATGGTLLTFYVKLGTFSSIHTLRKAFEAAGFNAGAGPRSIETDGQIVDTVFDTITPSKFRYGVHLCVITPSQLGFLRVADHALVCREAYRQLKLRLCTSEVVPQLLLQYPNSVPQRSFNVVTKPVKLANGKNAVYVISAASEGTWLGLLSLDKVCYEPDCRLAFVSHFVLEFPGVSFGLFWPKSKLP